MTKFRFILVADIDTNLEKDAVDVIDSALNENWHIKQHDVLRVEKTPIQPTSRINHYA